MLISCGIWMAYDWLVTAGGMLARAGVAAGRDPGRHPLERRPADGGHHGPCRSD